jgi:hypothetical protein
MLALERFINVCKRYPAGVFILVLLIPVILTKMYAPHPSVGTGGEKEREIPQWQGIPVIVNAQSPAYGVMPALKTVSDAPVISGGTASGLLIEPVVGTVSNPSPELTGVTLLMPLPRDVRAASFTIYQPFPHTDISKYAHRTIVTITVDGRTVKRIFISKDALLTFPVPVAVVGARQIAVELKTAGDANGGDVNGPWFPVLLGDLKLERGQGAGASQTKQ